MFRHLLLHVGVGGRDIFSNIRKKLGLPVENLPAEVRSRQLGPAFPLFRSVYAFAPLFACM